MQDFVHIQYYKSPYGEMILGSYDNKLCMCDWRYRKMRESIDQRIQKSLNTTYIEKDDQVLQQTKQQFEEYFRSDRMKFELPLLLVGTDFQKQVWQALINVPFGETSTYLKLAEDMGKKSAVRAVANANGANALSIIVPCHRIIGSNGQLVGYAGGLEAKRKLLLLEQDMFATQP